MADWLGDEVAECRDCRDQGDGVVLLCGWHESLAAAVRVVEATAGVVVRETDPLPVRLRRYADRVPGCWTGNDADVLVALLVEAADLLDGDR